MTLGQRKVRVRTTPTNSMRSARPLGAVTARFARNSGFSAPMQKLPGVRVIDSIQLTVKHRVATPVNWKQGEDVIIAGSVSDEEAKKIYPPGLEGAQAIHPDRAAAAGLGASRPGP
jgi:hypothetical protein